MVLTAEKGKGAVVMDRVDYHKVLDILNDPAHSVKLAWNPIPKSECELVELPRDLRRRIA